jgi:hypothetical protein
MVMDGLRQLDSVAYIRFASVYRDFTEARDFEEFASTVREVGRMNAVKTPAHAPVIVLVRPQLGENIGKAARAMLNFADAAAARRPARWLAQSIGRPRRSRADIVLNRPKCSTPWRMRLPTVPMSMPPLSASAA